MRKAIMGLVAAALIASYPAWSQIVPALPFQLQNNTVADATQVMANFNQILNNVNANSAKNGANSDITSLLGLTTPIAPGVGGTSTWNGGSSTGSANAQVVASVVPSTFTLTTGSRVVFRAGFTNTAAFTLNVAGTGAINVFRKTNLGVASSAGGEVVQDEMVAVIYNGTQWQMDTARVIIGSVIDITLSAIPQGYLSADGACVSQTTYALLFAVIGLNYGACGAGNFNLPDYRGRTSIGPDAGANRVTIGGSGCTATLALNCGSQSQSFSLAQTNLPNVNFTVTDSRTWSVTALGPGALGGPSAGAVTSAAPSALSVTPSGAAPTAASGGSGTAVVVTTLPPTLIVHKAIKY